MKRVVVTLSEADRLANHIPEAVWVLSRTHEVFLEDAVTGELAQVVDCTGPECLAGLPAELRG